MPVIKPINQGPCPVCKRNVNLTQFLQSIDEFRGVVKSMWVEASTRSICIEGLDKSVYWERTLKDEDGDMTMMPTFEAYDSLWKSSFQHNPIEFNWNTLDCCFSWDRDYVRMVSTTLDEQIASWKTVTPFGKEPNLSVLRALQDFDKNIKSLEGYFNELYPSEIGNYNNWTS